jgi:predicted  nucleic acid-binding Zn-ribbon protein
VSELQGVSEGLARKARALQSELDDATRAHESAHEQLQALQAAAARQASQLSHLRAAAVRDRQIAEDRAAAAEARWRERVGALTQE